MTLRTTGLPFPFQSKIEIYFLPRSVQALYSPAEIFSPVESVCSKLDVLFGFGRNQFGRFSVLAAVNQSTGAFVSFLLLLIMSHLFVLT